MQLRYLQVYRGTSIKPAAMQLRYLQVYRGTSINPVAIQLRYLQVSITPAANNYADSDENLKTALKHY